MIKNLRFIIMLLSVSLVTLPLTAAERSESEAEAAATAHFNTGKAGHRSPAKVRLRHIERMSDSIPALYVYTSGEDGGFVLIAADDAIEPVIAYGEGNVDEANMNPDFAWWMQRYALQIEQIRQQPLQVSSHSAPARNYIPITPIMNIRWNQNAPFNNLCPTVSGTRCPVGCVATAVSQVMRYYQYPTRGIGSSSYVWNEQTLSANYGATTYNWANMPTYASTNMTTAQKNAVSTLCYHMGVVSEMNYGISGSGTQTVYALKGMVEHFNYDSAIACHNLDIEGAIRLQDLIHAELNAGRPVVVDGFTVEREGHCFVCEGIDANGRLYINWGWGGLDDGYFKISLLDPNNQGTGGSASNLAFTENVNIYTGIRPNAGGHPITTLTCDSIAPQKDAYNLTDELCSFDIRHLSNDGIFTLDNTILGMGVFSQDSTLIGLAHDSYLYNISGLQSKWYYYNFACYIYLAGYTPGNYLLALCQMDTLSMEAKPVCSGIGGVHYFKARITSDSVFLSEPIVTIPGMDYTPTNLTLRHTNGGTLTMRWSAQDTAAAYLVNIYQDGEKILTVNTSIPFKNLYNTGEDIISNLTWSVQALAKTRQYISAEVFGAPFDFYPYGQNPPVDPNTPNPADSVNTYSAYNLHYDNTLGGKAYFFWSVQDTASYYEICFYQNNVIVRRDTTTSLSLFLNIGNQQENVDWSVRPMDNYYQYIAREEFGPSLTIYAPGSGPNGKVYDYTPYNLTVDNSTGGSAIMRWDAIDNATHYYVQILKNDVLIYRTWVEEKACYISYSGSETLSLTWSVIALNEGYYAVSDMIYGSAFELYPTGSNPTAVEQNQMDNNKTVKVLQNGKVKIIRGGQVYDLLGGNNALGR